MSSSEHPRLSFASRLSFLPNYVATAYSRIERHRFTRLPNAPATRAGVRCLLMSPTPKLQLRSAVPGRERWDIEGLSGKRGVALALEKALAAEEGVLVVQVNPLTGRVLIRFTAGRQIRCRSLLRKHLVIIVARGVAEPPEAGRNALVRILKASPAPARQVGLAAALS